MEQLPTLNALLNATAAVLMLLGLRRIRRGDEAGHKRRMLAAFGVSCLFLVSYLVYHASAGHVAFQGEGAARSAYLLVLGSHVVLAALTPFLVLRVVWLGLKDRRTQHRRWARVTFPVWLYVSVTGVLIYLVLYHLGGAAPRPSP